MIDLPSLCQAWPQGVVVLDDSHQVLFVNKKASEITGYSEEQLLDTSLVKWFEGTGSSIREEFLTGKLSYLLDHPNESIPQWWLAQNGEFIEVEAKLSVIDLPEQTVKLLSFEEFEDPEQSLFFIRKLAEFPTLIPQPLAQVGIDGSIEYSNDHLNDLMLEFGFDDMGHANVFPRNWQDTAEKCFSTQAAISAVEHQVDGHWYSWNFHPVFDQAIPFVLLIGQDVTDHIKHQRSLESINRMQIQSNKQKSQYMVALNAELQTPLSEIQTHAELLLRTEQAIEHQDWLRNIQYATKVLMSIVDGSEDRIRLENHSLEIRQRIYNPRLVATQTFEMLAPKIEAKALNYYLIIDPTLSRKFEGDGKRLGQIIRLLLNNAIDHTERGAIVLKLQRRIMAGKNWLRLSVTDSGSGMSPDQKSKLFSASANFGHSLPFVKQLLQLMGGQIGVHSMEGRGSSFFIDLPAPDESTEPPTFARAPKVSLRFNDTMWSGILDNYIQYAGVEMTQEADADLFFGDIEPSKTAKASAYIGSRPPSQPWDFTLPGYMPPRLFFDILQSVIEEGEIKSVSEIEKIAEEHEFEAEPLNLSILLVDDNEKNLTVFSDSIQKLGCQVLSVNSGEEALSQWFMSGGTIQLILLDCKMPVLDGYQTAERLREENFDGPIIGMTNRRFQDELDDVLRSGMTTCVTKPLDIEDLYNVILDVV